MAYEVPQPLRYEEKIVFGLTAFQSGIIGLAVILIGILWVRKPLPEIVIYLLIILISLAAVGMAFFGAAKWFSILYNYWQDQKKINGPSFLESFLFPIDRIADDTIYLLEGSMRAVLEVEPIHFQSMHETQKKATITAYRSFLNSLEFPVQILIQTKPILSDALVPTVKNDYWDDFRSFLSHYLAENEVVDRKFYLIIPYTPIMAPPLSSKGKLAIHSAKKDDLRGLGVRVRVFEDKLTGMGIGCERLNDIQLAQLLAGSIDGGEKNE